MSSESFSGPARLKGLLIPPGDKSISHRAVMFGALSEGESSYTHFLEAGDCLSTVAAFRAMGVSIRLEEGQGRIYIRGVGLKGLRKPEAPLDMGNSGTTTRLLLGILAGQNFDAILTGDESLSSRPMQRVTVPLKKMGAQIKGRDKANYLPLEIRGGHLKGIDFENKIASAQVKSAILLAGLYAEGETRIFEPVMSRDHTEKFLLACGAPFRRDGEHWVIQKADRLRAVQGEIPGDISAAAFFIVGAAMVPGSEVTVQKVCLNPTRSGVLRVLERMGAKIETRVTAHEPEILGDIHVTGGRLKGTRVAREEIPSLIDELPILMTAMALAEGESLISGAEELRVKETDRIASMTENLKAVGASIEELSDGCIIKGVESFRGGKVSSHGDHRTAMSLAVASLRSTAGITIEDTGCVAISFPGFFDEFRRLKG